MFQFDQNFNRIMIEEERKLLKEVSAQRMSWKKVGNMIKLNAIMRANQRNH
jgi:hypothetical protein